MQRSIPPSKKRPDRAGRLAAFAERRVCATAASPAPPAALVDAMTGRPFRWFIACLSWKSSVGPNSKRGGCGRAGLSGSSCVCSTGALAAAVAAPRSAAVAIGVVPSVSRWCSRLASRMRFGESRPSSTQMSGSMPLAWIERPARRVIARRGELEPRVVAERQDRLHRALAEGLRARCTVARLWSCSAPATISDADAVPPSTSTDHRHLLHRRRAGPSGSRRRAAQ